jgi:hypothetical protein
MYTRLRQIFILIIAWISLNQSVAFACCMCLEAKTPNEELQRVDVVFAGRVVAANQKVWRINYIEFERRPPFLHLTEDWDRRTAFEVTTVWKGDIFAKTSIIHSLSGSYCGYAFDQGEEYIVYAYWVEGELHTSRCARNKKLSDASEDLAAFGAGRPPAPNPSSVANYIGKPAAVFLLLSMLGLAGRQARRKYGVQK